MHLLSGLVLTLAYLSLGWAKVRKIGDPENPKLSRERLVFELEGFGIIEMAFFPEVAPATVKHILEIARVGGYTTNHFFRVDKGFVAQVADVAGNRLAPTHPRNHELFRKKVPGEFTNLKHRRGILSMARFNDPDSGTSSFSILLGDAPHLDEKYAIFGRVTEGLDVLSKLELLETKKEGIFVMPLKRITITSSYVYSAKEGITVFDPPVIQGCPDQKKDLEAEKKAESDASSATENLIQTCPCAASVKRLYDDALLHMKHHLKEKDRQIEFIRRKCLPG